MGKSRFPLSFATLLLCVALMTAPLSAHEPASSPLPDLEAMTAQQLLDLVRDSGERWLDEPCTFGAPVTEELDKKLGHIVPTRSAHLTAQALCADEEQRFADGARLVQEMNALSPTQANVVLALYFAQRLDDADSVLAIFRGLQNTSFRQLSRDNFWPAVGLLRRSSHAHDYESLALSWVESGKLTLIDGSLHSAIAVDGLTAAARDGREDMADRLLQSIEEPPSYISLLTDREYEQFWPRIEARAGPNLATIGAENVRHAQARLAEAPDDRHRFSDVAHALHYNGQFAEAIALAERWRTRADRDAAIEEGDGWALNIQAYAHDSLGQRDRADAVFDELAVLDPETHPWAVNFVINRASRLVGQGRWSEGLEAAGLARAVAEDYGTTYAKTIIARDHACALLKLGRGDEAASELAYLRENWREGIELAVQGLMCHGLRDEAAALLLQGLRDDILRARTLGAFTVGDLSLFYTGSMLPNATDLLAANPELAAELAKHVRPMPEAFIPQASLRRVRLELPAW